MVNLGLSGLGMNQTNERGSDPRGGLRRISALLVGLCALHTGVAARAQETATPPDGTLTVTVLRSNGPDIGAVGEPVDAALLRDLAGIAGIDNAQFSPIEYEEIQLTVGCGDQSRECLAAITGMAQVSGLVLRSVVKSGSALQLDLVYFDASSQDEPARASFTGNSDQLAAAVPSLVRQLFGIPDVAAPVAAAAAPAVVTAPVASTSPAPSPSGGASTLTIASIVTLAVGVGVGLAGVVVGASAASTFDDYKNTAVTDQASARRASGLFSDAESKATIANVLMPIGGALVIGGAIMMVLGLNSDSDGAAGTQVAVAPVRQGGVLMVAGWF